MKNGRIMQIVTFSKKKERAATKFFFQAPKKHLTGPETIFKKLYSKNNPFF